MYTGETASSQPVRKDLYLESIKAIDAVDASKKDLFLESLKQTPGAAAEMAGEAIGHPGQAATSFAITAGEAVIAGKVLSMFIPARGPVALATSGIMVGSMAYGGIKRVWEGYSEAKKPGADINKLAHTLARSEVSGAGDTLIGFGGGFLGAGLGHKLLTSETAVGDLAQGVQKSILAGENKGMSWLSSKFGPSAEPTIILPGDTLSSSVTPKLVTADSLMLSADMNTGTRVPSNVWFLTDKASTRVALADGKATSRDWLNVQGDGHAHSNQSDGKGTPESYFLLSKAAGQEFPKDMDPKYWFGFGKPGSKQFDAMTDHGHLDSRAGVEPTDPRAKDQVGVPIIAGAPEEYLGQLKAAAAVSEDGKYIALVGTENGTIGHYTPPGKAIASTENTEGGLLDITIPTGATPETLLAKATSSEPHVHSDEPHIHVHEEPKPGQVIKLRVEQPDGSIEESDYILPQNVIRQPIATVPQPGKIEGLLAGNEPPQTGASGQQAHLIADSELPPRYIHDHSVSTGVNHSITIEAPKLIVSVKNPDVIKKLPANSTYYQDGDYKQLMGIVMPMRASDGGPLVMTMAHPNPQMRPIEYGRKSFANDDEWVKTLDQRFRMIEIIKGEALNPDPVDVMKKADLSPANLAYYIDKGFHLGPVGGRDDHFHMPLGRPMGNGLLVNELTKPGILDAMRNRRVSASTSRMLLQGYMTTADGVPMGSILDQNAINNLKLRMNVGGYIDPEAQYKATLFGDKNIGDGKLATAVQNKSFTGQEILDAQNQIAFDDVNHTLGNKSAWYVQLTRVDPKTQNMDYLWTAPIWIEPTAGATHGLAASLLAGSGTQYLLH